MAGKQSIPCLLFSFRTSRLEVPMFQPLWMFVDQLEETQLDFFDICEPAVTTISIGLESQTANEGENAENDAE